MNVLQFVSKAVKDANPDVWPVDKRREIQRVRRRSSGAPSMNKTEAEFALGLFAAKKRGEIHCYQFESISLRWGDCMWYTPDFIVWPTFPGALPLLIEVKGGHIYDRDIVRFKGARAQWQDWFGFQMWQKKQGQWKKRL